MRKPRPPFHGKSPPKSAFTITATQPSRPGARVKYGDTFVVLDSHGDVGASSGGPDGLFHRDTRYLSRFELTVNELQPLLLGSNLRDDNSLLTVDLTNPDIFSDQRIVLEKDTLHIVRTFFLWRGTAYQRLGLRNFGDRRPICASRSCSTPILPMFSRCAACVATVEASSTAGSSAPTRSF